MRFERTYFIAISILIVLVVKPSAGHADLFMGNTPYLSFNDSPFNGTSFSYFHLEDFEDEQLNTPGASVDRGTIIKNLNGVDWVIADVPGPMTAFIVRSCLTINCWYSNPSICEQFCDC